MLSSTVACRRLASRLSFSPASFFFSGSSLLTSAATYTTLRSSSSRSPAVRVAASSKPQQRQQQQQQHRAAPALPQQRRPSPLTQMSPAAQNLRRIALAAAATTPLVDGPFGNERPYEAPSARQISTARRFLQAGKSSPTSLEKPTESDMIRDEEMMHSIARDRGWKGMLMHRRKKLVALVGPNNAGKSALLNKLFGKEIRQTGLHEIDRYTTFVEALPKNEREADLDEFSTRSRYSSFSWNLMASGVKRADRAPFRSMLRVGGHEDVIFIDTRGITAEHVIQEGILTIDEAILNFLFEHCDLVLMLLPADTLNHSKSQLHFLEASRLKYLGLYEPEESLEAKIKSLLPQGFFGSLATSAKDAFNEAMAAAAARMGQGCGAKAVPHGPQIWERVVFVVTKMDIATRDGTSLRQVAYDTGKTMSRFMVHPPLNDQLYFVSSLEKSGSSNSDSSSNSNSNNSNNNNNSNNSTDSTESTGSQNASSPSTSSSNSNTVDHDFEYDQLRKVVLHFDKDAARIRHILELSDFVLESCQDDWIPSSDCSEAEKIVQRYGGQVR